MNYSIDQNSIIRIKQYLEEVPKRIQRKVLRKALKEFGNQCVSTIRSRITWNSKKLKRKIGVKTKTYKRGNIIWMGAGALLRTDSDWRTLVKAHAYDGGWRPYPKGHPTNAKGKGWRKGKRRLGGTKIYQTGFISSTYRSMMPKAPRIIESAILDALREYRPNVK